jgi:1-deoxy-D-xylulose-5-phosphate reductoisomerase
MKKVVIMGSSGSIGKSTLDVIQRNPDLFSVEALAVNTGIQTLEEQIARFHPKVVAVRNEAAARLLAHKLRGSVTVLVGNEGLLQLAAECDYDIFVGAMVGFAGLPPTIEAIKRGKRIALANKETLVVAGQLVTRLCAEHHAELLPIDSEHGAIFQCLFGENKNEVAKIILTASGGPFFQCSKADLEKVTIADALNHPTWKMGSKITIDSATLMNKGLEIIEAKWLFDMPIGKIEVIIHPQSIIHSMVEFVDGSIKAQLSIPDMRIPIQLALSYPERLPASYVKTHFPSIKSLTFFEPDFDKFECLKLALRVLDEGGTSPCILNAANEVAVAKFLNGDIGFTKIPLIIQQALDTIRKIDNPMFEDIIACDTETRRFAETLR